jgi:hypothetical protein
MNDMEWARRVLPFFWELHRKVDNRPYVRYNGVYDPKPEVTELNNHWDRWKRARWNWVTAYNAAIRTQLLRRSRLRRFFHNMDQDARYAEYTMALQDGYRFDLAHHMQAASMPN